MAKQYSLNQLREIAQKNDVSFDLGRLYGTERDAGDSGVIDILKTGHVSEAANWLQSTTPEEMKYGTASREERITKAYGHAALAGVPLTLIAEERGLSHLLYSTTAESK